MQLEKENMVFVGGFAMWKQGLKNDYSDIDIVVTDLSGIENAVEYETDSAFSKSGKRAFVPEVVENKKIDIFIEDNLPEFEIIDGLKIQTIKSMTEYFENLLSKVGEHWKKVCEQNLKILKNE